MCGLYQSERGCGVLLASAGLPNAARAGSWGSGDEAGGPGAGGDHANVDSKRSKIIFTVIATVPQCRI